MSRHATTIQSFRKPLRKQRDDISLTYLQYLIALSQSPISTRHAIRCNVTDVYFGACFGIVGAWARVIAWAVAHGQTDVLIAFDFAQCHLLKNQEQTRKWN